MYSRVIPSDANVYTYVMKYKYAVCLFSVMY